MKKYYLFVVFLASIMVFVSFSGAKKVNIWMIGDSTMAKKSERQYPESGWGEGIHQFVTENTKVHNHAASGRSTKSFLDEGLWKIVYDSIQPGDFVIIQFGHNDEKPAEKLHTDPFTSFKENMKKFIDETRSKGAYPIVCSSIVRHQFDSLGTLKDTHGDYINAAKEISLETQTPYIDMEFLTRQIVTEMGHEGSKKIYNYTSYKQDSTHLNVHGAYVVAKLFVDEVKSKQLNLSKMFK